MRITKLAPEIRYNMSGALASAPREDEAPAAASRPPE